MLKNWSLAVLVVVGGFLGAVQSRAQGTKDETAIRAALSAQVEAWNKGSVPEFMATYENSPETTFIGSTSIRKGFALISERYKKAYSNKDQMGILAFNELDVRLLPNSSGLSEYAVVTGKFHLARTEKGEATKDDGIFSLVWHKSGGVWKILLDHTS